MTRYDGDHDAPLTAMPIEIYDEIAAGRWRGMGWDKPTEPPMAVAIGDHLCRHCYGKGELRDDGGYGFDTIVTCVCGGTGSSAHIEINPEVEHFDHVLRTITGLFAAE